VTRNFHESYSQGDVKPPSERSTGFVFVAVAVIVGVLWRHTPAVVWSCAAIAVVLLLASLLAPGLLKPLNILWFKFALLLHRIVNPVVMFIIFAIAFVPGGFLMRLKRDPLRLRRLPSSRTYWIERIEEAQTPNSMKNQF
jgi:hypothetical protein